MKVYVVVWFDGGTQYNQGVFKTRKAAEEFASDSMLQSVEEWELK